MLHMYSCAQRYSTLYSVTVYLCKHSLVTNQINGDGGYPYSVSQWTTDLKSTCSH